MKTLILKTNARILSVHKNEDGTITLKHPSGEEMMNAGSFISSMGGIGPILKRCFEIDVPIADFIKEEQEKELEQKELRKIENKAFREKIDADRKAAWDAIKDLEVIPSTVDNIRTVLLVLNEQNWGGWRLPKMSIGYSAHQYDCDGKTASTMKLDTPIDYDGEQLSMFKVGAPIGHLGKYRSL